MKLARNKIIIFSILIIILFISLSYAFFLKKFATFLIINSLPSPADAIVVLSGDKGLRLNKGVELYHRGYARQLIISGDKIYFTSHPKLMAEMAKQKGVPEKDIILEEQSLSTYDHPRYIEPILKEKKIRKILIVTSYFHTRRVKYVFDRYYQHRYKVTVIGAPDGISYKDWWKDHNMIETIVIEWGKTLWYFFMN